MKIHVTSKCCPSRNHLRNGRSGAMFDELLGQSLLDGEYGRLEPFHQRQTLSHRLVQYHGQMRMPVLKGPGHKALRPVNGLHYILVTATRRESPILIQQEVSLVSYATVIYQPSVCDSPRSGVHTNPHNRLLAHRIKHANGYSLRVLHPRINDVSRTHRSDTLWRSSPYEVACFQVVPAI